MSVSIHFWALPPSSALFQRLERDKAFVTLMAALFPYGRGVFFFFDEIKAGERKSILERVTLERRGRLGPAPEAAAADRGVPPGAGADAPDLSRRRAPALHARILPASWSRSGSRRR